MVVYYVNKNSLGVEVFNGINDLLNNVDNRDTLKNADLMSLRSGELFIERINSVEQLKEFVLQIPAKSKDFDLEVYREPMQTFIGKEAVINKIKEKYDIDDGLINEMLFIMKPDCFYGLLSKREFNEELDTVHNMVLQEVE
jgi:hypothetical protein